MNNIMEYKGYLGSVEFSEPDGLFYGKVQGIRSLISYEGTNAKELVSDFHGAVDDYLALCKEEGTTPEIPYKVKQEDPFYSPANPAYIMKSIAELKAGKGTAHELIEDSDIAACKGHYDDK